MSAFDYTIDAATSWPPKGRPQPPYGPGSIEVMRSCPLRSCFESSPGYERRMGFAARIGTAFHRVLQSLHEQPVTAESSGEAIAEEARSRFAAELHRQTAEAAGRPREASLPREPDRARRAEEAAVAEALRIGAERANGLLKSNSNWTRGTHYLSRSEMQSPGSVEVEIPVTSASGLFQGRVDRAEHGPQGVVLFDYKSALRDDLPERYERQLQLYACMWYDTRREWPVGAFILYPLTAAVRAVDVSPSVCLQVAAEAEGLVANMNGRQDCSTLAAPGDVCRVCEFRPWCRPFWTWQNAERLASAALAQAVLGFEGTIAQRETANGHWIVRVAWRSATVELIAPLERLPQLQQAQVGTQVRVLDTPLRGLRLQPRAMINSLSEVFLLKTA